MLSIGVPWVRCDNTRHCRWGGVGAARRQKWSSLLAPLLAVQAGGWPAPLSSYTWKTETPLAAARLVYLSTSSVLACTGLRYTRGSPTPLGGDAGARSSSAPHYCRQRPCVHRTVGWAPRIVLLRANKSPLWGYFPQPCWAARQRPWWEGSRARATPAHSYVYRSP